MKKKISMKRENVTFNKSEGFAFKGVNCFCISIILFLCLTIGAFLVGCRDKGNDYYQYFNNFKSSTITSAECVLNLDEHTYISSYDPMEDVFITTRTFNTGENSTQRYGLASIEKEYCLPVYYQILQVYNDYAIVARTANSSEINSAQYIDVIRFRGAENTPYSLMGKRSLLFSEVYTQLKFVGEYLVAYGDANETSSSASYATFYDYKKGNELLEVFKIRAGYDTNAGSEYEYLQCDDYLVAYSTDKAFFYNLSSAVAGGYLEATEKASYVAFSEMTDSLSSFERSLEIYYLGNGWFVRSAMLSQYEPFNGFNIRFENLNEDFPTFARSKCDFFNIKTGITKTMNNIYCVAGVGNKYTLDVYTQQAYMLGSIKTYDQETGLYDYELPFGNPASMVKEGYSLLYYYYLPYVEMYKDDETTFLGYTGETTYCIIDENLNYIQPENALMPTAYIDGVGLQNSDPIFSEISGTAYSYDRYMNKTVLASFVEGSASYIPYYGNKDACIIKGNIKGSNNDTHAYYGASTPDGKRITDFIYDKMTFFSGGYAIGTRTVDGKSKYFRIDLQGNETPVDDVLILFQGTYSYKEGDKVGLKNYKGDVVIAPIEGVINISDETMNTNGQALISRAIVTINNRTKIYLLK